MSSPSFSPREPWSLAHAEAITMGEECYDDPETGYLVFTEGFHLKRGTCCGSGCRHCPFGHASVAPTLRRLRVWAPTLYPALKAKRGGRPPCDVLLWEGPVAPTPPLDAPQVWVTRFDPDTKHLRNTETSVDDAVKTAASAGRDLLLLPVRTSASGAEVLLEGMRVLQRRRHPGRIIISRSIPDGTTLKAALTPWAAENGVDVAMAR